MWGNDQSADDIAPISPMRNAADRTGVVHISAAQQIPLTVNARYLFCVTREDRKGTLPPTKLPF